MRYWRMGAAALSLGALLAGFLTDMDALVYAALWLMAGALALGFWERPALRAASLLASACLLAAGFSTLAGQGAAPVLVLPGAAGDRLIPVDESAYRAFGACVYALAAGCWLGEWAAEALMARGETAPAGWASFPVRLCAFAMAIPGMLASAWPGLSEWVRLPAVSESALALLGALATPAVAAYVSCSRYGGVSCALILLYAASAVFSPELFAQRAFFAAAFSLLMCARSRGKGGVAFALAVPLAIAATFWYRVEGSPLSLYMERLSAAVAGFLAPGGLEWAVSLYARFGYAGLGLAGAFGGAVCFFLGGLARDSFVYAAPAMAALGWGCLWLYKGNAGLPEPTDGVLFACVYGLCLIVGAVKRAKKQSRASASRGGR